MFPRNLAYVTKNLDIFLKTFPGNSTAFHSPHSSRLELLDLNMNRLEQAEEHKLISLVS